ncbi:MAG: type II 3-dehydroquinate dehydratase [Candidatus Wallbacteria bacterium]|nr:type II 3-dehydroquinate dehydratase [Candidatus Wallbacteria bacterium]
MKFLLLHGPNINLLGERKPEIYGTVRYEQLNAVLVEYATSFGVELLIKQSNHEGELIDLLQKFASGEKADPGKVAAVVFNPGAYTHTSIALRDAVEACTVPVIEVHMTNVHARESFRQKSAIAPVCMGQISGFGVLSYFLAIYALVKQFGIDGRA